MIDGLRVGTVNGLISDLTDDTWLLDAAPDPDTARTRWAAGRCADLTCGLRFDVLRLPAATGIHAVRALQRAGAYIGPIVHRTDHDTHRLDFLLPPHTATPHPAATVLTTGTTWPCPPRTATTLHPPARTAGWLVPPGPGLTEPAALHHALTPHHHP